MKERIYNLVIVILFLAGTALMLYPAASDFWNQHQQDQVSTGYQQTVDGQSREELARIRKKAEEYNRALLKDQIIIDPFDQVADRKVTEEYYKLLNPQNNGVMGTIRIPSIEVSLPVYHGTEEDVLQKAVGHLEQTSFPIGGKGTHAVLSGHRGLPSAELFTNLDQLEEGDVFYLDVLGDTLAYQVDKIRVAEANQLQDLAIVSGKDYVTLVTCTPYAINSHRLLVRGARIPYEAQEEDDEKTTKEERYDLRPYLTAAAVAGFFLILWKIRRKHDRRVL